MDLWRIYILEESSIFKSLEELMEREFNIFSLK